MTDRRTDRPDARSADEERSDAGSDHAAGSGPDLHAQRPGETPQEDPVQDPQEMPGDAPQERPDPRPEELPGDAPGEIPADAPGELPQRDASDSIAPPRDAHPGAEGLPTSGGADRPSNSDDHHEPGVDDRDPVLAPSAGAEASIAAGAAREAVRPGEGPAPRREPIIPETDPDRAAAAAGLDVTADTAAPIAPATPMPTADRREPPAHAEEDGMLRERAAGIAEEGSLSAQTAAPESQSAPSLLIWGAGGLVVLALFLMILI